MPANLQPAADKAIERHKKRHHNPGVVAVLDKLGGGYAVDSPHSNRDAWEAMVCDALGTRSASQAKTFLVQLSALCKKVWEPDGGEGNSGEWYPDEDQLNMLLNFVAGVKPRNEMEAALAAQMVAIHMLTMKGAAAALEGWGLNRETAAITGKLARTFAMQTETMAKLKGRRTSRQSIKVSHEKHIHHHEHVHLDPGVANSRSQPHAKETDAPVAPVPGATEVGRVVLLPCRKGSEDLSNARRHRRGA